MGKFRFKKLIKKGREFKEFSRPKFATSVGDRRYLIIQIQKYEKKMESRHFSSGNSEMGSDYVSKFNFGIVVGSVFVCTE